MEQAATASGDRDLIWNKMLKKVIELFSAQQMKTSEIDGNKEILQKLKKPQTTRKKD